MPSPGRISQVSHTVAPLRNLTAGRRARQTRHATMATAAIDTANASGTTSHRIRQTTCQGRRAATMSPARRATKPSHLQHGPGVMPACAPRQPGRTTPSAPATLRRRHNRQSRRGRVRPCNSTRLMDEQCNAIGLRSTQSHDSDTMA